MADCCRGCVGNCLTSLFIMKHNNCVDNFNINVYNNENSSLNNCKCILDEKFVNSSSKINASTNALNAFENLEETNLCTIDLDSISGDSDNFKKNLCMDRYDSSESSDSGVLTGSTCSESSSNSGNSDITDPCSPYSITSFHLGDDSGSPSSLPSRSELEVPDVVNNIVLSSGCLNNSICTNTDDNESSIDIVKISQKNLEKENTQMVTDTVTVYKNNIRFPSDNKSSFLSDRVCRWTDCVDRISSSTKLIEHLQTKHVNPQTFSETFVCLWNGCKVFGRPSCSRTWLERHVLGHGGNKPYRCIVHNCGLRFSSQLMLERHINQHFKTPKEISDGVVDTTPKLIRRNGQKLRYRRQPFNARGRTDVFDAGIMSQLQYLLVQMARRSKSVSLNVMDSKTFLEISFQPKVIGSRQEANGEMKYLVRWYPYNALEDEWLPKSEIKSIRNVPIWKLPASVQQSFWESVFPNQRCEPHHQSRKFKPDVNKTVL